LSRNPLATGAERVVDILVEVERGEDEHARAAGQPARRLDSVHHTGAAAYLALLALLGLGIGAIARQTGVALTAMLGLMLVPVLISGLIGGNVGWTLQKLAPMTAGLCIQSTVPGAPLGPAAGLGVAGAWTAGALLIAFVLTARRDI
jgi:ABC-2 type transport system permease protein